MPFSILHDDPDLIAIEKPAGLAAIPGRGEDRCVLELVAEQLCMACKGESDPRLRIVHRLDKNTSGVLLFARHLTAQRYLCRKFQNNTVKKEYLALVAGRPNQTEGEIDAPIGPHPTARLRMAVLKHGGRPARTLWKIEGRYRDFTLLRVFPKTGKTHQIRVHLAHIGLPLAIDPLYHPGPGAILLSQLKRNYRPKRDESERPLISRLTLHAQRLAFNDLHGRTIDIDCPVPRDLRAVINQLSRHGA